MKKFFWLAFFVFLIFTFSFANVSACVNITLSNSAYLPGETFQAEITGNFSQPLAYSNIFFFKEGKERLLYAPLVQISKEKYFLYANLPPSDAVGAWTLEARDVLCIEQRILKGVTKSANFSILKPLSDSFTWLSSQVRGHWPASSEENALALLSLADDAALASEGKTSLNAKSSSGECWPALAGTCDVKSTALALMALKNLTAEEKNKIVIWLADAQNSLSIGLWDIFINSNSSGTCKLNLNDTSYDLNLSLGENLKSLNPMFSSLSSQTVDVSLNCSIAQNAKIIHTHSGRPSEFSMVKEIQNETVLFKTSLNNKKCWGNGFRDECNASSTAFAILALRDINSSADLSNAVTWLKTNSQTTQEKALAFLFSQDTEIEAWLLNNQAPPGFWSTSAIALDNRSDIPSTIITLYSLIDTRSSKQEIANSIAKAKLWLKEQQKNNLNNSILNEALFFSFIYGISDIEPIMSVDKGIIRTVSNSAFGLTLRNKGILPLTVNISITDLGIGQNFSLNAGDFRTATIMIPARPDNYITNIEVLYGTSYGNAKKYSIPIIIFASGSAEQIVPSSPQLLPTSLVFLEDEIRKNFTDDKNYLLEAHLKNNLRVPLYNISIDITGDVGIILSTPNYTISSIGPGENKTIMLNLTALGTMPAIYEGNLNAMVDGFTTSLPLSINITSAAVAQNKTCAQLNGTTCKEDEICSIKEIRTIDVEKCCTGKCEKPAAKGIGTGKIIGIIMIGVAVLVIILFLMRKPKKPKPELKEVIEKIEEKYKK